MNKTIIIRVLLLSLNFTLFACADSPDKDSSELERKSDYDQININTKLKNDTIQETIPDNTVSNTKITNNNGTGFNNIESKEGDFKKESKSGTTDITNNSEVKKIVKNNSNLSQVQDSIQEIQPLDEKQKESEAEQESNEDSKPIVAVEDSSEVNKNNNNSENLNHEEKEEKTNPVDKDETPTNTDEPAETTPEKSEEIINEIPKETPQGTNTWIVSQAAISRINPIKSNKESIKIGKSLYSKHCKSCHGKEGLGDGSKAAQLDTPSGDFTADVFITQSDGALFYKTVEGRDDMPSYKKKIPDEEDIWHIVNYLRTLSED